MKIAVDLDNTLVNLDFFGIACWRAGVTPRHTSWEMPEVGPRVIEESIRLFENPDYMGNLAPLPDTEDTVRSWCRNHEVDVVTSRPRSLSECTAALVTRLFPGARLRMICEGKKPFLDRGKPAYDVVIDDAPHHITHAINCGVPRVIMISNDETSYNHRFRGIEGLEVVEGIADIKIEREE